MMFDLTTDSTEQYQDLGVFTQSGGIEVARTPERMIELRRGAPGQVVGASRPEILSPGEVNKLALPGRVGHPGRRALPDRGRGRLAGGPAR